MAGIGVRFDCAAPTEVPPQVTADVEGCPAYMGSGQTALMLAMRGLYKAAESKSSVQQAGVFCEIIGTVTVFKLIFYVGISLSAERQVSRGNYEATACVICNGMQFTYFVVRRRTTSFTNCKTKPGSSQIPVRRSTLRACHSGQCEW